MRKIGDRIRRVSSQPAQVYVDLRFNLRGLFGGHCRLTQIRPRPDADAADTCTASGGTDLPTAALEVSNSVAWSQCRRVKQALMLVS